MTCLGAQPTAGMAMGGQPYRAGAPPRASIQQPNMPRGAQVGAGGLNPAAARMQLNAAMMRMPTGAAAAAGQAMANMAQMQAQAVSAQQVSQTNCNPKSNFEQKLKVSKSASML